MRAAGVPLVPGTDGRRRRSSEIREAAEAIGFPVMLKATAGGGGKGMRLVDVPGRPRRRVRRCVRRGGGGVRRRRALPREGRRPGPPRRDPGARATRHGQRAHARRARVLDPAPPPEARRGVAVARAHAGDARGDGGGRRARVPRRRATTNAGTFEFLLGPRRRAVLHRGQLPPPGRASGDGDASPGIDIVREQVRIAAGEPLAVTGRAPRRGHAIEIRINAEDPARGFAPSPGRRRALPAAARARCARRHGRRGRHEVPPYYDSLIAKVIVSDDDRPAAIARALRALARARGRGDPDDAGARARRPPLRRLPVGRYSTGYLEEMEAHLPSLRPA